MRKYFTLLRIDLQNIGRDPMLIMISAIPVLYIIIMRFLVPLITQLLNEHLSFDLGGYYLLIAVIFSMMPAMFIGMTTAFLCLDENDNQISSYLFITPLMKKGYLDYRLSFPLIFSLIFTFVILSANGLYDFAFAETALFSILASLLSLFFFFILITFSSNKVEGLALGKALGIVVLGPVAAFLLPSPFKYIAGIIPPFWTAEFMRSAAVGENVLKSALFLVVAAITHILPLIYLFKRYMKKLD